MFLFLTFSELNLKVMFLFSILYLSSKTLQIRGAVISLVLSAQKHCEWFACHRGPYQCCGSGIMVPDPARMERADQLKFYVKF